MPSSLKTTFLLACLFPTALLFASDSRQSSALSPETIASLSSKEAYKIGIEKEEEFFDFDFIVQDLAGGEILDPPPEKDSEREFIDEREREDAVAFSEEYSLLLFNAASKHQKRSQLIKQFGNILKVRKRTFDDSVFDYAKTLGHHFNDEELPKTNELFLKLDDEVRTAVYIAKHIFRRRRPMKRSGFAYPSGHTTRAFLYESLLSKALPKYRNQLYRQAQSKGWHRVILGKHYPADVCAGQDYGEYLVQELFKSKLFQEKWNEVSQELQQHFTKGKKG